MRLETFNITNDHLKSSGLKPTTLKKLGAVVAFVGKNGAGKSRLLNIIENFGKKIDTSNIIAKDLSLLEINPPTLINDIPNTAYLDTFLEIDKLQELLKDNPKDSNNQNRLNQLTTSLQRIRTNQSSTFAQTEKVYNRILNIITSIRKSFIKINYNEIRNLQIGSENEVEISFEKMIESVTTGSIYNEISTIHKSALTYLRRLPHQLVFDMDEVYGNEEKFLKTKSSKRYQSLKNQVSNFLNKDLTWTKRRVESKISDDEILTSSQGIWELDGREFNYAEFSDGEKTLFAFSLLFFLLDQNPNVRIKESIIIIDEPELHLHPAMRYKLISGIRNIIEEKGQLFIATHSIDILSNLNHDEIFMIKKGEIIPPSRTTPGDSFLELMEVDTHIEKLNYFISNISNWAFLNFITQCFNNPDVIQSVEGNDPQVELFKSSISEEKEINMILDFGAGKGRFFKEFFKDSPIKRRVNYYGLEIDNKNIDILKELPFAGLYSNYKELPKNAFDYILLCNVLHEIEIEYWVDTLNAIKKSLKESGTLVILEDKLLPKGEKIGKHGFLILDKGSIKVLFSMNREPGILLATEERHKDRILCTLISKKSMGEVTHESIVSALQYLRNNTYAKIKENRDIIINNKNKYQLGKESAFHSQLYINTLIAEETIKAMSKETKDSIP